MNERNSPEIPQQPAHLTRKPVVGMNKVIFFALPLGKLHHAAGEGGQLGGQIFFIQALVWPGDNINDAQMRRASDSKVSSAVREAFFTAAKVCAV